MGFVPSMRARSSREAKLRRAWAASRLTGCLLYPDIVYILGTLVANRNPASTAC